MRIYLKNNPAKLHPDLVWKDRAWGFFEERRPNKKQKHKNNKMSSDMRWSKKLRRVQLFMELHLRAGGVTCHVDHTPVLPSTRHKWTVP